MAAIIPDNLTSWQSVQNILGLPNTTEAPRINQLITEVSYAITERMGRRLLLLSNPANPLTEFYSGKGGVWLLLRHRPVYTPILFGNTTSGSPVVSGITGGSGPNPTSFLFAGQPVTGAVLPVVPFESGATAPANVAISAINSTTELTLTQNAAASATQTPLYFGLNVWGDDAGYWGSAPGTFPSTAQFAWGSDFAIKADEPDGTSRAGMLLRLNDVWDTQYYRPGANLSQLMASGMGNYQVQYAAGWPTVPADVEMAVIRVIAKIRNSRLYGDLLGSESKSDGSGSYSYNTSPFRSQINMGLLGGDVGPIIARYAGAQLGD